VEFENCKPENPNQQWTFEHTSPKHLPLPLDAVPAWKDLQNTRNRIRRAPTHPQHWKQNPNAFIHPNFASPTNSTLPEDFFPGRLPYPRKNHTTHTEISHQAANLSNSDRDILSIENRQFIESQSIKHETKLANEIRQLYCKITAVQRSQTVLLAQSNGLLAAQALNLQKFSRISGSVSALTLHVCAVVSIQITAKLTTCGYQPFFQGLTGNFTIGKDGWSLHPFHECFWPTGYVSINGQTFVWKNDDWKAEEPSIHLTKLKLVDKFEDIPMNAYNYLPHHHSIYDSNAIEEINVLTELISRIQLSNTNSLSELVLDKQSKSEFWDTTNWISIFKYGTLGLICLITLTALSYLIIFCVPFKRIFSICTLKNQNA
jgi:hypothetical protein